MSAFLPKLRSGCWSLAFVLAVGPSFLKMYETSHWFREGDDTPYDKTKEWFDNPGLPYETPVDNPKELMRIYFFIVPYILSALFMAIALALPSGNRPILRRNSLVCRSMLQRTIDFPQKLVDIGFPVRITVGELIGATLFLIINLMTIWVRIRRSNARGSRKLLFLVDEGDQGRVPLKAFSWQAAEVWAKTLGVVSIVNMGWYLLMPVGRKSILLEALGMSWERAIKYHRWVGYYSVCLIVLHSFLYYAVWAHGNGNERYDPHGVMAQQNMSPWGCASGCSDDQKQLHRHNMYGQAALFLVLVMTVFALPWFRRRMFELFYYMHHLFVPLLVFICLHYPGALIYLIPGIALYSVDKLMGFMSLLQTGEVKATLVSCDIIEIEVDLAPGAHYLAGQYAFVNVPSVSSLEWHPYSITSSPRSLNGKLRFHIKEAGDWTQKVIDESLQLDGRLKVRLDGFYGHDAVGHLITKDAAIFVGGGIGLTPMLSVASELCEVSEVPVTLMWVVKTIDEFNAFSVSLMEAMSKYGTQITVKVWITMSLPEPNLEDELAAAVDRDLILEMSEEEQMERVTGLVRIERDEIVDVDLSSTPPFVMNKGGLSGAMNAVVMAVAMWMSLNAYAISSDITRDLDFTSDSPDRTALVRLIFILASIVGVVAGVMVIRAICSAKGIHFPSLLRNKGRGKNGKRVRFEEENYSTDSNSNKDSDNDDASVGTSSKLPGIEILYKPVAHHHERLLETMLKGRLGCRPDIEAEFRQATSSIRYTHADVGVMACGPTAMIESINTLCNEPSSEFSWGLRHYDGREIFLDFTEDDWEW